MPDEPTSRASAWPPDCRRGERASGWLTGEAWHALDSSGRKVVVVVVDPDAGALERENLFAGLDRLRRLASADSLPPSVLVPTSVDPTGRWFVCPDPGRPLVDAAAEISAGKRSLLIASLADTLEGLHSLGIVHGALSPASVFITEQGGLALGEVGCADLSLIAVRRPHGHPDLLLAAPEVLEGEPAGARSDVFALGALANLLLAHDGHLAKDTRVLLERCSLPAPSQRPTTSDLALELLVSDGGSRPRQGPKGFSSVPAGRALWDSHGEELTAVDAPRPGAESWRAGDGAPGSGVESVRATSEGPHAVAGGVAGPDSDEAITERRARQEDASGVYPSAHPAEEKTDVELTAPEGSLAAASEPAPPTTRSGLGSQPARTGPATTQEQGASSLRLLRWVLPAAVVFALLVAAVEWLVR